MMPPAAAHRVGITDTREAKYHIGFTKSLISARAVGTFETFHVQGSIASKRARRILEVSKDSQLA